VSILFSPYTLGRMEIKNRFVFSACEDNLADEKGFVSGACVRKLRNMARNEIGLIISSHLFVHPWGRTRTGQLGIHDNDTLPGLQRLADTVHGASGKIVFQLGHAGSTAKESVIGRAPLGPSARDGAMNETEIRDVVRAFGNAAGRAADAGADGIQIHAAHGYLINQFLSPFFNHRNDSWGGTVENRFRLLREIVEETRRRLAPGMALLVKMNASDHTPEAGITPPLAVDYARRLAGLNIDGLEVSCGTSALSPWNMCRGDVPVAEILRGMSDSKRAAAAAALDKIRHAFGPTEAYNLDSAIRMRPVMGHTSLFAVGGWRHVAAMEAAVHKGETDLIAMCRPFLREPSLVRKIHNGKTASSCIDCNRCLIALAQGFPGRCYRKGLPESGG